MVLLGVLAIALGAAGASPLLVAVLDRRAGWPIAAAYAAAAAWLLKFFPRVLDGEELSLDLPWVRNVAGTGIDAHFALRGDGLSLFFALIALIVGAFVFTYSASYLHHKSSNLSFYLLMSLFMASVLLLVLSADVTVLFIAWELVSLGSFLLIARAGSGGQAGATRTLILTFTGGVLLLVGLGMAVAATGTTNLTEILASDFWTARPVYGQVTAVILALAAFSKCAQFPFHFWLPEAMAAATPVSAFLHAAAVVKAGIYVLIRLAPATHSLVAWQALLIVAGLGTAVMSSLFAIQKTDLKKLTAYSTVSHLGWIVATIGVGTPFALAAALVHTLAHAMFKSSLFMLIGVIDHQTGTRDVRRLGPLIRRMPWTFASVVVAALSMAAVPPTIGFISKEAMLEAFEQAPGHLLVLAVAAVGALFTFTYTARFVFGAFVDGPRDMSQVREAPVSLWLPAAIPGALSLPLALGVTVLDHPVGAIAGTEHLHLALWHGLTVPLGISVLVTVVGVLGIYYRRPLYAAVERRSFFPVTGNEVLSFLVRVAARVGKFCARFADSFAPARHLTYPLVMLIYLGAVSGWILVRDGVALPYRSPGVDRPIDALAFLLILVGAVATARTRDRLWAVVWLTTTGMGVTLFMLVLGAPDVALTQLLVELLLGVFFLLVLRHRPRKFHFVGAGQNFLALLVSLGVGATAAAGSWFLLSRRAPSELSEWYLNHGLEYTGGSNVVNTILVEFRGLDTMGELTVLGMTGVVIAAVVGSIPRHHSTPLKAFGNEVINSLPARYLLRLVLPVIGVLSVLIFFRGHNAPGGGFIAALVTGGGLMLVYLARPADQPLMSNRLAAWLTGGGVLIAAGTGFWGFSGGSFLYALHGEVFGEHLSSAMLFDLGVYLSVLGMIALTINEVGGPERPGSSSRLLPFRRGSTHPLRNLPGHVSSPKPESLKTESPKHGSPSTVSSPAKEQA